MRHPFFLRRGAAGLGAPGAGALASVAPGGVGLAPASAGEEETAAASGLQWRVSASLAGVGLSAVVGGCEVAYARATRLAARLAVGPAHLSLGLESAALQLDDPRPRAAFPVVAALPAPRQGLAPRRVDDLLAGGERQAGLAAALTLWRRRPAGVLCVEDARLTCAPLALWLAQEHLEALAGAARVLGRAAGVGGGAGAPGSGGAQEVTGRRSSLGTSSEGGNTPPQSLNPVLSSPGVLQLLGGAPLALEADRKLFINLLALAPLRISLSFLPTPLGDGAGTGERAGSVGCLLQEVEGCRAVGTIGDRGIGMRLVGMHTPHQLERHGHLVRSTPAPLFHLPLDTPHPSSIYQWAPTGACCPWLRWRTRASVSPRFPCTGPSWARRRWVSSCSATTRVPSCRRSTRYGDVCLCVCVSLGDFNVVSEWADWIEDGRLCKHGLCTGSHLMHHSTKGRGAPCPSTFTPVQHPTRTPTFHAFVPTPPKPTPFSSQTDPGVCGGVWRSHQARASPGPGRVVGAGLPCRRAGGKRAQQGPSPAAAGPGGGAARRRRALCLRAEQCCREDDRRGAQGHVGAGAGQVGVFEGRCGGARMCCACRRLGVAAAATCFRQLM